MLLDTRHDSGLHNSRIKHAQRFIEKDEWITNIMLYFVATLV
jgi:hypothetical protein